MRVEPSRGQPAGAVEPPAPPTAARPVSARDLWALWLCSLTLYLSGLWIEPLRDWEEGTYAEIAREIAARGWAGLLHPTLWGAPYLNKPPLLFGLMAVSFQTLGESAFAARLPGAVLTAAMVPLLALLVSDLTGRRDRALWVAVVLLTLLPVLRHGRLAMLDGTATTFFVLMLVCLVRSGRLWSLGAGLGLAGMLLTKGLLALPLLAIAIAFQLGRRTRPGVWAGLALGTLPALGWFGLQWAAYGSGYLRNGLVTQGFDRLAGPVEGHHGTPVYYLLEIGTYAWPWLLFLPAGLALAWKERRAHWARLALIWLGGYLGLITLMPTKLPWYVFPAYPALAMLLGSACADVMAGHVGRVRRLFDAGRWGLLPLGLVALAGAAMFSPRGPDPVPALVGAMLVLAGAFLGSLLLWRRGHAAALPLLVVGATAGLLLFTLSGRTVWELNEETRVQPLAALIRAKVPEGAQVYTTLGHNRPSLNYYAGRPVIPHQGREPGAYWLTTPDRLPALGQPPVLGGAGAWVLAGPTDG